MDNELRLLLRSVRAGTISDSDRIRQILADAREQIEKRHKRLDKDKDMLFHAEQAFLHGWPAKGVMNG